MLARLVYYTMDDWVALISSVWKMWFGPQRCRFVMRLLALITDDNATFCICSVGSVYWTLHVSRMDRDVK
jgi:hypothetical protein